MEKLAASDKIYISKSKIPNAGRGVFAKSDIRKGEIVETCPIIDVPEYDFDILNESSLVTYFFYHGKGLSQLLIALGFGSIYNHSYEPNAKYKIKYKERVMEFWAIKDIGKKSEITVNYNPKAPKGKSRLWFE